MSDTVYLYHAMLEHDDQMKDLIVFLPNNIGPAIQAKEALRDYEPPVHDGEWIWSGPEAVNLPNYVPVEHVFISEL